ncbi:MAG: 50S ribosomal protein L13 [Candidatus Woesearchaeota archaeon]
MIVIDATDMLVGRFATKVAKMALLGEEVVIVNCEMAYISGSPLQIKDKYQNAKHRGAPLVGPYISRSPDKLVRRSVRGMLPHRQGKGRDAFKRIMTYIGVPTEFKDSKMISYEDAKVSKLPNLKYISMQEISRHLGSKRLGEVRND